MIRNFLNSRGFTLVEVLASVVLLAVVLSISLSIFPSMFRTNDVNQESLDAVTVAKDALVRAKNGELKTAEFEQITSSSEIYMLLDENSRPSTDDISFSEPAKLNSKYKIYFVVKPTGVDDLDLFRVTIYIIEGKIVKTTNYGYLDYNPKPDSVVK